MLVIARSYFMLSVSENFKTKIQKQLSFPGKSLEFYCEIVRMCVRAPSETVFHPSAHGMSNEIKRPSNRCIPGCWWGGISPGFFHHPNGGVGGSPLIASRKRLCHLF